MIFGLGRSLKGCWIVDVEMILGGFGKGCEGFWVLGGFLTGFEISGRN